MIFDKIKHSQNWLPVQLPALLKLLYLSPIAKHRALYMKYLKSTDLMNNNLWLEKREEAMFCLLRQVCPPTHILIAWADLSKWFFTAVKIMSHKTWVTHVHRRIHKTFITFISNENQEIQKSNFHESYYMTHQKIMS